jgi:hypothetical protein
MKFEIVGDVITAKIGQDYVLLNERFDYIMIDATGRAIWEGLTQGNSVEDIAKTISASYTVTTEKARKDAEIFIGELARLGLIKMCG